jgi:hypothetical protein
MKFRKCEKSAGIFARREISQTRISLFTIFHAPRQRAGLAPKPELREIPHGARGHGGSEKREKSENRITRPKARTCG